MSRGFRQPESGPPSPGQNTEKHLEDIAFYNEYTAENTDSIRDDMKDLHDTVDVGAMSMLSTEQESKRQTRYQERLVELAEQLKGNLSLTSDQPLSAMQSNVDQIVNIIPPEDKVDDQSETVSLLQEVRDILAEPGKEVTTTEPAPDTKSKEDDKESDKEPRRKGAKDKVFKFLNKGMGQLVNMVKKLEVVMKATQLLMAAKMNAAMLAVVALLTAAVIGIDFALVRFKDQLSKIWEFIQPAIELFETAVKQIGSALWDLVTGILKVIESTFGVLVDFIVKGIEFYEYFESGQMATDIKNGLSEAWGTVTDKFDLFIDEVKKTFTIVQANLQKVFGSILSKIPGFKEKGREMIAQANDTKIKAQGRSATDEELEQQVAHIKDKYGDKDADDVSPAMRDQYFKDGKFKSDDEIKDYLKVHYDAYSMDDRAKNVKTLEDAERFNNKKEELTKEIQALHLSDNAKESLNIMTDSKINPELELKPADTINSKESIISEDIDKAEQKQKIQQLVQKNGDNNAVSLNASSTQVLYQAPPTTGRQTPGFSNILGTGDF